MKPRGVWLCLDPLFGNCAFFSVYDPVHLSLHALPDTFNTHKIPKQSRMESNNVTYVFYILPSILR